MDSTLNTLAKLYADRIEHIERRRETEVFFLSVEAYPEPGSPDFGSTGGAFVHCYIDADDLRAAEQRMVALLRQHGWRPHRLEGWEITSPDTADRSLNGESEVSQFDLVQQALEDEHALAFYCWDIDAEDAFEEEPSVPDGRP